MSEAQRAATPVYDYRPFIIADADTGHGGYTHEFTTAQVHYFLEQEYGARWY
jgi:isocitrate lyase